MGYGSEEDGAGGGLGERRALTVLISAECCFVRDNRLRLLKLGFDASGAALD